MKKKTGQLIRGKLNFSVVILNEKRNYGHINYLIKPVSGSGEEWVRDIILDEESKIIENGVSSA